jgi:arylsulfatase A
MHRRAFLSASAAALAAPSAQRPNILMIYADDLGIGDLSCYGSSTIHTPNLDRLAGEGMRFTQFYSASPFCTPSRSALLTGRYPIRNGMNIVLFPDSKGGIPKEEVTIASLLRQQGYGTSIVGKWHLGHLPQYLPTNHGFDSYFGIPYSNDMSPTTSAAPKERKQNWPPTPLIRNLETAEQEPDQSQITKRYTDETIKLLDQSAKSKKPFFHYLAHTMPHWPLAASKDFRGRSKRGLYGDAVEELDHNIGRVLDALRRNKQDRNTLIFFSSDNGAARYLRHEGGAMGTFQNGKGSTWEGGQREPGIAWWPGKIRPGLYRDFATTMDLFPTFASLGGAALPKDREYDGIDIAPYLFQGKTGREVEFYYYNQGALRAVRKGDWKLHVETNSTMPAPARRPYRVEEKPLLFNVMEDEGEEWNQADKHPEIVKDLLELFHRHKAQMKPGVAQT